MKKRYVLLGLLLLPTVVYASDVFGERVTMWLIHNYYEEECLSFEWEVANETVDIQECLIWDRIPMVINYSTNINEKFECIKSTLHATDRCIKYHLVRKV